MWFITPIRERFSVLLRWIPRTMYSHKRMRSYKLKMGRLAGNKKHILCQKKLPLQSHILESIDASGIICKSLIQEKLFSTAIIWTSDLLARGWEIKKDHVIVCAIGAQSRIIHIDELMSTLAPFTLCGIIFNVVKHHWHLSRTQSISRLIECFILYFPVM